ncbi:MAG: RusA family crossover junction endodeoxyribonuclease [Dehalococcoidia bacterium]|nr:RusA family crossover junction endodeoxyribonuclease [Dehalococcoidia bacterium]
MIKLSLPLPPSVNQTNRAAVNRKSGTVYKPGQRLKDEFIEWTRLAAIAAGVYHIGLTGRLALTIRWYGSKLDIDNGVKTLADSLALAIGFNDAQIKQMHLYHEDDADRPHCEIELAELGYEEANPWQ